MKKPTNTTLIRMLRVGESLSFDQGRIKVELEEKSGRAARLRLILQETVLVDKAKVSENEQSGNLSPAQSTKRVSGAV